MAHQARSARKRHGATGTVTAARLLALETTRKILERDAYAQALVSSCIDTAKLSREERAFAALLTYGVVSSIGTLDELIDRSLRSPKDINENVRSALRQSVYEIVYLKKEPYVAVDQGVELVASVAPRARGLANAILRKVVLDSADFPFGDTKKENAALARQHGYPLWMVDLLVRDRGREMATRLLEASDEPAPLYCALNPFKVPDTSVSSIVSALDLTPFGPAGCYVTSKPRVVATSPELADGRLFVCDASAQVVARLSTPRSDKPMLEVGSGRGTKSMLLQANALRELGKPASLYALDLFEFKQEILASRMKEALVPDVHPLVGDATDLDSVEGLPAVFDTVFVDAPCSGLGTLRRHAEKRWRLSSDEIVDLAELGGRLLACAATRTDIGGTLIYATCTVTRAENEDVIARFLESEAGARFAIEDCSSVLPSEYADCVTPEGYFLSMPRRGGYDGHFAARLTKTKIR